MGDLTKWFAESRWGVLCHWLGAPPSSDGGADLTSEAWNGQVDAFDVEGLARQLETIAVPYCFLTIGQNSGHYLAPNATYDRYVGIQPSKCSRRDLVADLYEVLHPRGIDLLVYLPSGAPASDPVAVSRLGWKDGSRTDRTDKRVVEFQRKWEAIIREWSTRWGPKVRGWWIDGCYFADAMYRHTDEPNFCSFAAAIKAGNPDSLVAFNDGVHTPLISLTEHEDYTAGEIAIALPECRGAWVERNGHNARFHVLSYLGESWCKGSKPRFPDELVIGYTKHVTSKGGVVTWDAPIGRSGLIPTAFMEQLSAISQGMRRS